MRLNVTGPNMDGGGTFHVHAADCADLRHRQYRNNPESCDEIWTSLSELVDNYYCDIIDESGASWEDYADDFKVFPCASDFPRLPRGQS